MWIMLLLPFGLQGQDFRLNPACFEKMVVTNEKGINSKELETFPYLWNDTLFFIQGKDNGKDYQIVKGEKNSKEGWESSREVPGNLNTPFFEGPFVYDFSTQHWLITRSNFNKKILAKAGAKQKDSIVFTLSIWDIPNNPNSKPAKLTISDDSYSVSDPAVSPDGNLLVFTSDQPWGYGGRDLYVARKDGNQWVGITNLGKEINSDKNEGFASFANEEVLFFASDRPGGNGGFDIYYTTFENGLWAPPKRLPKPINSSYDDMSFIIHQNEREGFFASNRSGGKGEDDIYRWSSPQSIWKMVKIEEEVTVDIFAFEKLTLLPFPEADIYFTRIDVEQDDIHLDDPNIDIVNLDTTGTIYLKWSTPSKDFPTIHVMSDDRGNAQVNLTGNAYYKVESSCEICDKEIIFYKPAIHGKQLNLALQPNDPNDEQPGNTDKTGIASLDTEDGAGTVFVMENIYYEYDSDKIQISQENDLDILVEKMAENEDIKVLLEAHTDCRGNNQYNLLLSRRRAQNAKNYLVERGISPGRIQTRGLGESRPRNHCKDGVTCTEEEHRYNRRTEVIILPGD